MSNNEELAKNAYWLNNKTPPIDSKCYIVYSAGNNIKFGKMGDILDFSIKKHGIDATVIRLLSLDRRFPNLEPQGSKTGYTLVCPENITIKNNGRRHIYRPLNRPFALQCLNLNLGIAPDSKILQLDTDMLFDSNLNVNSLDVADNIFLGQLWKNHKRRGSKMGNTWRGDDDSLMFPVACSMRTLRKIIKPYYDRTVEHRQNYNIWTSEMFGFVAAINDAGITRRSIENFGLCNDWDRVKTTSKDVETLSVRENMIAPILHYCQKFKDSKNNDIWSKHSLGKTDTLPDASMCRDGSIDQRIARVMHDYRNKQ